MIRKLAASALLVLAPAGAAIPARASVPAAAPAGIIISLAHAGRCLAAPHRAVRVAACEKGAPGQSWRAYDAVSGIRIRQAGGRCLTVTAAERVTAEACGHRGQRWSPRGAFSLHPWRFAGRCLAAAKDGRVTLLPCRTRQPRQRWDWVRPTGY